MLSECQHYLLARALGSQNWHHGLGDASRMQLRMQHPANVELMTIGGADDYEGRTGGHEGRHSRATQGWVHNARCRAVLHTCSDRLRRMPARQLRLLLFLLSLASPVLVSGGSNCLLSDMHEEPASSLRLPGNSERTEPTF